MLGGWDGFIIIAREFELGFSLAQRHFVGYLGLPRVVLSFQPTSHCCDLSLYKGSKFSLQLSRHDTVRLPVHAIDMRHSRTLQGAWELGRCTCTRPFLAVQGRYVLQILPVEFSWIPWLSQSLRRSVRRSVNQSLRYFPFITSHVDLYTHTNTIIRNKQCVRRAHLIRIPPLFRIKIIWPVQPNTQSRLNIISRRSMYMYLVRTASPATTFTPPPSSTPSTFSHHPFYHIWNQSGNFITCVRKVTSSVRLSTSRLLLIGKMATLADRDILSEM